MTRHGFVTRQSSWRPTWYSFPPGLPLWWGCGTKTPSLAGSQFFDGVGGFKSQEYFKTPQFWHHTLACPLSLLICFCTQNSMKAEE